MTKPFATAKGNPLMHRHIYRPKNSPMAALMLGLLIVFALGACSSDDSVGALEIIGEYNDNFGGSHTITSTTWTQVSSFGTSIYEIDSYSNSEDYLIGLGDESNGFNPGLYDRFDWTTFESSLYYCTSVFGEATADDAKTAGEGLADTTDPSTNGCGVKNFSWTRLDPA